MRDEIELKILHAKKDLINEIKDELESTIKISQAGRMAGEVEGLRKAISILKIFKSHYEGEMYLYYGGDDAEAEIDKNI